MTPILTPQQELDALKKRVDDIEEEQRILRATIDAITLGSYAMPDVTPERVADNDDAVMNQRAGIRD